MQTAHTVLILLILVGISKLVARVIPIPLPLVQIAAGLLWPALPLGFHVESAPKSSDGLQTSFGGLLGASTRPAVKMMSRL
ncbi:hypothetical protein GHO40_05490 [Pseudomonas helleri]|uniref:Na+/H+ antiporter n=1 Tax=Pseudomonas helleri TaxID=1608996 RepID=A0A7X2BHE0_9PSED|nr:hypothetical protein [Pseudomonas helleri]MQT57322.1 hypothetical protein [Pseudomonas sp. FSL R10-0399]MQT88119.1 hypothetical protein [Pseudomonas helleri]